MHTKRIMKIAGMSVPGLFALSIGLYAFILWEGSSAREDAPALEGLD